MAHNRTQLNDLIFHNQTVLPRSSSAFTEVTLAVAELQGGNNTKAAAFAEAAVLKDPALAAGWLAKTAADVFEATPQDLRKERALFCMERALECVPTCRREIIEFFVANILGHYVEVLCAGAVAELAHWQGLEAQATELDHEARRLGWQATRLYGGAALLEAAGLVTGLVALSSRRLGTKVVSGVASFAAFSEATRKTRDAALLEAMSNELRAASTALRLEGAGHRTASMPSLFPARDLVGVAAQLLEAGGLPPQPLDRLIQAFTDGFRQVLDGQLGQLCGEVGVPMLQAIHGQPQTLTSSYGVLATTKQARDYYDVVNPLSRGTVLWLEHMLPGVKKLGAYQLLANPMPTIGRWVYGFDAGTLFRSLPQRIETADESLKVKGGSMVLATIACLFFAPVLSLLAGAGVIYYVFKTKWRARTRARVQDTLGSLWSADTWLRAPLTGAFYAPQVGGGFGPQGAPALPAGVRAGEKPNVGTLQQGFKVTLVACGSLLLWFVALVVLLALVGPRDTAAPPAAKKVGDRGPPQRKTAPAPPSRRRRRYGAQSRCLLGQ